MVKVKWYETSYNQGRGFAPVRPDGSQGDYFHHCKEVFASRLNRQDWGEPRKKYEGADGTLMFLYLDPVNEVDAAFARRKEKVMHLFETAMGFAKLAKVNVLRHKGKKYLLYRVSVAWNQTLPMSHILALLVRNHYPADRPLTDWKKVLTYFRGGAWSRLGTKSAIKEIVENKGSTNADWLVGINGISDYASKRNMALSFVPFLRR